MAEGISVHRPRYDEIDVSRWPLSGEEDLGTKPKRWLINPNTGERWLMKDATFSRPRDGLEYRKGDDWAERIAYAVAVVLGLPAAQVELSVDSRGERAVYGIICRSVLKDTEALVHGNALLAEQGDFITRRDRQQYTVEAIYRALVNHQPPTSTMGDLSTWEVFVGYLVLDAIVGNTDRHEENWAVIESESGRYLAPTFDHASSLGFLLSEAAKRERLSSRDRNRTPEGYADRAKTPFVGKPHPIAVVHEARILDGGDAADHWLDRPDRTDDLVAPIWAIPEQRMSTSAREFAERVLRHNWGRLTRSGSR